MSGGRREEERRRGGEEERRGWGAESKEGTGWGSGDVVSLHEVLVGVVVCVL